MSEPEKLPCDRYRHPPECPDGDFCRGNRMCYWGCRDDWKLLVELRKENRVVAATEIGTACRSICGELISAVTQTNPSAGSK